MKEIARGAEAIIYSTQEGILKKRPKKKYRHPKIDETLRKRRTRKEAKVLSQLTTLHIEGPKLLNIDEKTSTILMSEIQGEKLRDALDQIPTLMEKVGTIVEKLHDNNLVHGDLTTSNMIVTNKKTIALIDFGLSQSTSKIEDKAVDLHLLKQALNSKHHTCQEQAWKSFLHKYNPHNKKKILDRLQQVELRGRNKHE